MKVSLMAVLCFLASTAFNQKQIDFPKLNLELGAGYEYANLKAFNEDYIAPVGYGKFLNELHSGWSANLRAPLKLTPAVDLAMMMNFRQFRMKDQKPFDYSANQPYDNQTNQMKLIAFEGGLQTTVYIDQFWRTQQDTRFNVGVFGSASYAYSKYRSYIFRQGEGYWLSLEGEHIHHFNTSFGMALRYQFKDSFFNSLVLNTGFNCATAKEKYNVDLNGYFLRLLIGLGK